MDESGSYPTAWNDVNQDGVWNHTEQMMVMNTKFERQMVEENPVWLFTMSQREVLKLPGVQSIILIIHIYHSMQV